MSRLRAVLLLIVAAFLLHESLLYLRMGLYDLQFQVYPRVGTTATGDVIRWEKRYLRNPWRTEVQIYDGSGPGFGWQPEGHPKVVAALEAVAVHSPLGSMALYRSGMWRRMQLEHAYLFRPPLSVAPSAEGGEQLATMLNNVEQFRRPDQSTAAGRARQFGTCDVTWSLSDGRFLATADDTGAVLVGIGPDGVTAGAAGIEGERFGELAVCSVGLPNRQGQYWLGGRVAFVDSVAGVLHVMTIGDVLEPSGRPGSAASPVPPSPQPSTKPLPPVPADEPVEVDLRHVPIPEAEGELRSVSGILGFWGYSGSPGIAVARGREVIVLDWRGELISRTTLDMEVDELIETQNVTPTGAAQRQGVGFAAVVPPIHPVGMVERHLLMDREFGTVSTAVVTVPRTALEHAIASTFGILALTRPSILNVVAFAGDGPAEWDDFFLRGVRDPFFARQRKVGWLVVSLLLSVLCGWWTRRHARRQLGDRGAVLRWTAAGALLGPVGVAWMWITVPRRPVLPCNGCGNPYGVGLSACPACGAAWPRPDPTEAEIHG